MSNLSYAGIRSDVLDCGRERGRGHDDGATLGEARRGGVRWCEVAGRVMNNV
jgi:hypothetical protein